MTPIFCCGFECGVFGTAHWSNAGSTTAPTYNTNSSFIRSGARSIRHNPSASTCFAFTSLTITSVFMVGRIYVYFSSLPIGDCPIIGLDNAAPFLAILFKSSDGKLYPGSQNSGVLTFGSQGFVVTTGVWYLIDFKSNSQNNPHLLDVQINGTTLTQYSLATAGRSYTQILLGNSSINASYDLYFDDFILSNTLADYPIGAGYVNHFTPISDGTHNVAGTGDFQRTVTGTDILNATTTAFQLVDDVPLESGAISLGTQDFINMVAPPNATDYVECIFGPAAGINTPTVAPRTVEIIAAIAQAGTGNGNMEISLNDNGTTGVIYTATGVAGVTTIAFKRAHFLDPPSAATQWTLSGNGNFNNLRFRFGSPAAVDANPDQYLVSIMAEAEFAPAVAATPNKIHQCNQAINRASTY